jgi:toxin ParE1/3/4
MSGYQLTPQARSDLDEIADYIATEATVDRAMKVIADLREEFRKLAAMPGMGHYREDLLDQNFRFWTRYSYVIAYRWNAVPIEIIAIVHGARDLNTFLENRLG